MKTNVFLFFSRLGIAQALNEWTLTILRVPLFLTIIGMWAYVWWMIPSAIWERLGLDWGHIVWYFTLTEIVIFFSGHSHRDIERDIWEKKFETHLTRPQTWLPLFGFFELGRLPFNILVIGTAGICFALVTTRIFPFGVMDVVAVVIHMVMGSLIWISLLAIVGLSTLWLRSAGLCYWVTQKAGFILGGLLLPITLYPQWLQIFAFLTPFPAIFYIPGQVVLPNSPWSFSTALLYQICILLFVQGALLFVWRAFQRKLLQEG